MRKEIVFVYRGEKDFKFMCYDQDAWAIRDYFLLDTSIFNSFRQYDGFLIKLLEGEIKLLGRCKKRHEVEINPYQLFSRREFVKPLVEQMTNAVSKENDDERQDQNMRTLVAKYGIKSNQRQLWRGFSPCENTHPATCNYNITQIVEKTDIKSGRVYVDDLLVIKNDKNSLLIICRQGCMIQLFNQCFSLLCKMLPQLRNIVETEYFVEPDDSAELDNSFELDDYDDICYLNFSIRKMAMCIERELFIKAALYKLIIDELKDKLPITNLKSLPYYDFYFD